MTNLSKLTFKNLDDFIKYHFDNVMTFEKPTEPKTFEEFTTQCNEQTQYNMYYNQLIFMPYTISNRLHDMNPIELDCLINTRTFLKNYIFDSDGDFLGAQFSVWFPNIYGMCYIDTVENTINGRCKNVKYLTGSLHNDTLTAINEIYKQKIYNIMMKKFKQKKEEW